MTKSEYGREFEGALSQKCGRLAAEEVKFEKLTSGNGRSKLNKCEFLTDKMTLLSLGAAVSGIYCIFAGYWFTAPLFFIGAVLFSPQLRKRHSGEIRLLSILGLIMLVLGICFGILQSVLVEMVIEEATSGYSYYEPTTNEERYGNWGG